MHRWLRIVTVAAVSGAAAASVGSRVVPGERLTGALERYGAEAASLRSRVEPGELGPGSPRLYAEAAQPEWSGWGRREPEYDGRFTFVRLRWGSGFAGNFRRGGMSSAWNHDYPAAEQNLMTIIKELTLIDAVTDGSLILTLDDPRLFDYPIAYMWEPGYWTMTDAEGERFREYLLKGGFAIFDDFEGAQWNNFAAQMRRVLPDARWVKLDKTHRIFDSFFRMETIDFPHPMYGILPTYYGIYEDNDPSRRLMVVANHDNDVAEYWEWSGKGLFPVDASNEAYKLGVNYMLYGMTH